MRYPEFARSLLGAAGFSINITGRRRNLVLSGGDRLFAASSRGGEVTARLCGSSLRLNLANPSERVLNYAPHNVVRGYRDSDLFLVMSRLAGSGGLFIDIGANLGIYSLLARTLGFETLLFEPEPVHYAFLSRNAAAVGRTVPCALSDTCGQMAFFVSSAVNPGSSSLLSGSQGEYDHTILVDVFTFDEMAAQLGIELPSIRLIKIDVEGNEERTLAGMRGYLARSDACAIWCEVRGPESGRRRNSVVAVTAYMENLGYKPFACVGRRFVPFRVGIDRCPQVFDLLFAAPARHRAVLMN